MWSFDPAAEKNASEPVDDFQAEFERLVQLDQEWRDHFAQTNLPMRASAEEEEKRQFMFDSLVAGTSLQEMLLEQVRESALPEDQWPIAEMLIGNIDEYGYLKATVEELAASTGLPPEQIAGVLKVIQTFDPPGVGARDLRECLLLQFERLGQQNTLEYRIVNEFMDALGKRRIPEIARGTGSRWTRCRRRWSASPGWSRGPDAPICPITTNTSCRRCSCASPAMIMWSRPTTSTSRTCASATPTRI